MEDSDIIKLYRSGEQQQAFNLIVRKYKERLYWHIRRMTSDHTLSDDILQNVFIKVWKALDTFREDSKLYTWLYRIATNETITALKRERLRAAISLSDYSSTVARRLTTENYFSGDNIQLAIQKAISKLPPKQRTVFTLRYFDEMKYEEISEILNTSEGSLKASYHHAYVKVQQWVKDDLGL